MRRFATTLTGILLFGAAHAATITVTNTMSSGMGSLYEAIQMANDNDIIDATGVAGTIQVTEGSPLVIGSSVTINGPGANSLTIDGQNARRIFWIEEGVASVDINDLTLANGTARGGNGSGYPVRDSAGGGGLGAGGALFARAPDGPITLRRCTIYSNRAIGGAGGLQSDAPDFTLGGGGGGLGGDAGPAQILTQGEFLSIGGAGGGGIGDSGTSGDGGEGGDENGGPTDGMNGIIPGNSGGAGGSGTDGSGGTGGLKGGGGGGGGGAKPASPRTSGGGGGGGLGGNPGTDGTGSGPGNGGDGEFGGGGGGGGANRPRPFEVELGNGGNGGFGGGGGAGNFGGNGGFGGGGGRGSIVDGTNGFAAGAVLSSGRGNGGAGLGGALFLTPDIDIILEDCTVGDGMVTGGRGRFAGLGLGSAAFLMQNSTLTVAVSSGLQTVDDTIAAEPGGGDGGIIKDLPGDLRLTGSNSYDGGTCILDGAVEIAEENNLGTGGVKMNPPSMTQTPILRFLNPLTVFTREIELVGNTGTIDVNGAPREISGSISGAGSLATIGGDILKLSGNNTYTGGTQVTDNSTVGFTQPTSLGTDTLTLDPGTLRFDTSTTISNRIDVASDSRIDVPVMKGETNGILSGGGNLEKIGSGRWLFTGDGSSYDRAITVAAGELRVNSTIAGTVVVNEGATLSGNGEVGAGTIFGTVSPGNSIGTLTFNGVTIFAPTCHYLVEIDAMSSDLIVVNGIATLGGTVDIVDFQQQITCGTTHTILQADSLVNQFDAVTVDRPLLIPTLLYSSTDVQISLMCDLTALEGMCPSYNSINTVNAIIHAESQVGDIGVVFTNLINLAEADMLCPALDAMSGSQYPTLALLEAQGHALYGQALTRRLIECRCCSCLGTWARPYVTMGSVYGDGNAAGADYTFAGVAAGVDYAVLGNWTLGMSGNYAYTNARFKEPGRANANVANFALYGTANCRNWYFDHVIAAGYLHNHLNRHIDFGDIHRSARSDFEGWRLEAYGETGFCCTYCGINFSPIGFLQLGYVHNDSFKETGADSINLQGNKFFYTSVLAGLGGRATLHCGRLCLEGRTRWQVELADTYADINLEFEGIPDQFFNIRGVSLDRNFALIGIGARYGCLYADYDLKVNSSMTNHDFSAGAQWTY